MIGKVQDIVSGAVVIGAAEKAGSAAQSGGSASSDSQPSVKGIGTGSSAVKDIEKLQDEWNKNPNAFLGEEEEVEVPPMDEEAVSNMTDELNDLMDKINCNLEFTYNKEVDVMSVKMIDKSTEEVIKEFPPEEMVKNMIKAKEWIGAFLDRNA